MRRGHGARSVSCASLEAERSKYLALLSTIFLLIPFFFRLCKNMNLAFLSNGSYVGISRVQKAEIWRDSVTDPPIYGLFSLICYCFRFMLMLCCLSMSFACRCA